MKSDVPMHSTKWISFWWLVYLTKNCLLCYFGFCYMFGFCCWLSYTILQSISLTYATTTNCEYIYRTIIDCFPFRSCPKLALTFNQQAISKTYIRKIKCFASLDKYLGIVIDKMDQKKPDSIPHWPRPPKSIDDWDVFYPVACKLSVVWYLMDLSFPKFSYI